MSTLTVRPMSAEHLDNALVWARDEGWNPGRDDAAAFRAADPSGFLMGWLGTLPIGCISVVKYGADFAFLSAFQQRRCLSFRLVEQWVTFRCAGWKLWYGSDLRNIRSASKQAFRPISRGFIGPAPYLWAVL